MAVKKADTQDFESIGQVLLRSSQNTVIYLWDYKKASMDGRTNQRSIRILPKLSGRLQASLFSDGAFFCFDQLKILPLEYAPKLPH